jgi:predicted nucleic acid-binding protein
MILLDTNVVSELMRSHPDPSAVAWVDARPRFELRISAITRAEIELGISLLPEGRRKEGFRDASERLFGQFHGQCLPFDEKAALRYAEVVYACRRAGRPIRVEDAQIATTALAGGSVLATRNVADFEGIAGLTVVDPFAT